MVWVGDMVFLASNTLQQVPYACAMDKTLGAWELRARTHRCWEWGVEARLP